MSTQKSQSHKRKEQNNTEWLDELINKIENMKNKISITLLLGNHASAELVDAVRHKVSLLVKTKPKGCHLLSLTH